MLILNCLCAWHNELNVVDLNVHDWSIRTKWIKYKIVDEKKKEKKRHSSSCWIRNCSVFFIFACCCWWYFIKKKCAWVDFSFHFWCTRCSEYKAGEKSSWRNCFASICYSIFLIRNASMLATEKDSNMHICKCYSVLLDFREWIKLVFSILFFSHNVRILNANCSSSLHQEHYCLSVLKFVSFYYIAKA